MKEKIKVLVVDDSALVRTTLTKILNNDPLIEVIDTASDPYIAVKKIAQNVPDVITLDIEMPRMNGLTFLEKLMRQHPIPVVIISSVAEEHSGMGIRALKLGATGIITKPKLAGKEEFEEYTIRITDAVKAAAMVEHKHSSFRNPTSYKSHETVEKMFPNVNEQPLTLQNKIILIGASTGGTEVISQVLKNIRPDLPGILIVQHMPGEFTKAFANRLDAECSYNVKEAEHGEIIKNGTVYIASGYHHLALGKQNGHYVCKLEDGGLVNRHRPSVDVLFNSAVRVAGSNAIAILLTGMGTDGAKGMLELHKVGALTFAQDRESSVVFGMPREAIRLNAAKLTGTPSSLISWLNDMA